MKYRRLVAASGVLLLVSACQGRERPRGSFPTDTGASPSGDAASSDDAWSGPGADAEMWGDAATPTDDGGSDTGTTTDAGTSMPDSSAPPDTSTSPDTSVPTCPPAPGALAIVEVMVASQSGTDRGEWFEVVNTGACTIDLAGLEIGSPTSDLTPVTHSVTAGRVSPGGHFVFALSGDPADNHDLPFDYVYGTGSRDDVFLGNTGDVLTIAYGGLTLDRIEWTDADFVRGMSMTFPRGASPADNDDLGLWCDASSVYSTRDGVFYGTPGAPNDTCP